MFEVAPQQYYVVPPLEEYFCLNEKEDDEMYI